MADTVRITNTKGRRALIDALKPADRSQSWLSRQLNVAQSSVGLWVHGRSRPEPHLREALEFLLGIPKDSWTTEEERNALEKIRSANDSEPPAKAG